MESERLIPHLFRAEYSKIVAVLCRHFGLSNMEVAEDLASEAFLAALNTWPYQGIPSNPTAWLYTVAKNKTKNYLVRQRVFREKVSSDACKTTDGYDQIDLSESNITDSQLQMLFAVCDPVLPAESQIGLALRTLCGFGIDEIANAFLTNKETINKRLFRAREKLRTEKVKLEFPAEHELITRLEPVLLTLYLLFNEGYYSETNDAIIREDLCAEAMRLTDLLLQHPLTNVPEVNALFALMCFHASRFPARKDNSGSPVLYQDQDERLWDQALIARGIEYLHNASTGTRISRYHLEAGIAYWHTQKSDTMEKWENILHLYNHLLLLHYSPVAALNRTYALSKVKGPHIAIKEAKKLGLHDNPFYFALLGELYKTIDSSLAQQSFEKAIALAKTNTDRTMLTQKLHSLNLNQV